MRKEHERLTADQSPASGRTATYLSVGIGLTVVFLSGSVIGGAENWTGNTALHTIMETAATLLAWVVGAMALVRFYSKKENVYLFVGVGFLGTGLLDSYHTVVTSAYFRPLMPVELTHLVPWSWVAPRMFLSVMSAVSWAVWVSEQRQQDVKVIDEKVVYFGTAIFTLASFLFFAFVPLPRAYYAEFYFHRPEEFVPALFFLIALCGYLRKGKWRTDPFEHWFVLSLIVGFICQAIFMSRSGQPFDYEFDVAHLLKKASYICVLVGLLIGMYATVRRETAIARELDFQKLAVDEHAIVSITDVQGNITYVNDRFCQISGFSRAELMGQNHRILKSGEHSGEFYRELWRTIANGETWHGEIKNTKKDGGFYWVRASIVPFLNDEGKPFQYVAIRTETTEYIETELALKESQEQLAHAAEVADLCHWRADADMTDWLETSKNTSKILGIPADTLLGDYANYLNRVHPDDRDDLAESYEKIGKNPQAYELEYRVIGDDGDVRYLWEVSEPEYDEDGRLTSYRGTTQNVTARKVAENEAILSRQAADKANQAKSEFLSSMSHELRTPLNAILGFSQLLEYTPKEPLTEAQQGSVDRIKTGGEHLLRLIDNILDLAGIEAGKTQLSIESIPLNATIHECLSLVQTMSDKRGIHISFPEDRTSPFVVLSDSTRLRQVILNLLSNAIKYNKENGRISIELREVSKNRIRISVSDTGPGIPEDRQHELFQPFSRLGAENTEIEGSGIGLVVTRELVKLMGGETGFESTFGQGSTFWIEIPLASRDTDEETEETPKAADETPRTLPMMSGKILYIEDNLANVALMEQIVDQIEGLTMVSSLNAELGLQLAIAEDPDLIIMDINLPGMNGLQALAKLKTMDQIADIPVIAISAAATKTDIQKGVDAGFAKYVTKPIRVYEVTETIKSFLHLN